MVFRNVFKFIPYGLEPGNIYQLNKYMNNHLKTKIEQATMQSHILIKEKTKCERLFDFPPSIDLTSKDVKELVFYKDEGGNFEDVLFTGMELEWLIFVIYVWEMWCIALQRYNHSFPISISETTSLCQNRPPVFYGRPVSLIQDYSGLGLPAGFSGPPRDYFSPRSSRIFRTMLLTFFRS